MILDLTNNKQIKMLQSIINRLTFLESNLPTQSTLTISENINSHNIECEEKKEEVDNCPICLEELTNVGVVNLGCNHKIHLNCFEIFRRSNVGRNCPLCRTNINSQIIPDSDSDSDSDSGFIPSFVPRNVPVVRNVPRDRFVFNDTHREILRVFGNHTLPIQVIKNRCDRNGFRRTIGTHRINLNMLSRHGYLRKNGSSYTLLRRS